MLNVANVATPATAATVVVPPSVPPPGFAAIDTVTLPVNLVAVFPCASLAVSCAAGLIGAPAVVLVGGTVNASCVAAPGVISKAPVVAPVTPVAAAVSV